LKGDSVLLTFTGPSAVGKSTLMKRLRREDPIISLLTSTTTRKQSQRDLEDEYDYIPEHIFPLLERQNFFLWTTRIHGNCYGTRADSVAAALSPKRFVLAALAPNTVEPLHSFAARLGQPDHVQSMYISSPGQDVLRARLEERNPTPGYADRRLQDCADWDREALKCTYYTLRIPGYADLDRKVTLAKDKLFRTY